MTLSTVVLVLAMAFYVAAAWRLFHGLDEHLATDRTAMTLAVLAATSHLTVLLLNMFQSGGLPWGFFGALMQVSLVTVVAMLLGSAFKPLLATGMVLFPMVTAVLAVNLFVRPDVSVGVVDYDWQLDLHVALSVAAFAVLSLSAAHSLILAYQDRQLRRGRFGGLVSRLPPLATMERLLFQLIAVGFMLLTLALVSGVTFVDNLKAQHLTHKTVLTVSAWLVFGTLIVGRLRWGWRGQRAIRMTLAGMVVLLLAYFGSKLVLELILKRTV